MAIGAGLDTFAQREPELASQIRVFEVDQPGPQTWKRERLTELGYGIPRGCAWCRLEVDEVGVSLRNATAKVAKVTRTSGGEAQAGRQGSGKDADPWAGDAPGGYSDEPPS